jgi:hypothetical protein
MAGKTAAETSSRSGEVPVPEQSTLILPFYRCGDCNGERNYMDPKGKKRCFVCEHPSRIFGIMMEEKRANAAFQQSQVNDFIDEDIDIQDYNFRHFGQRIS